MIDVLDNPKVLAERREECAVRVRAMASLLQKEGRDFTKSEQAQWDQDNADIDQMEGELKRWKRLSYIDGDAGAGLLIGRGDTPGRRPTDGPPGESTALDIAGGSRFVDRRTGREVPSFHRRDGNSIREWLLRNDPANQGFDTLEGGSLLEAWYFGRKPRDEAEARALAEGTDTAGGFTVPSLVLGQFLDALREQSVVLRAGVTLLPIDSDNVTISRINVLPTVAVAAEAAAQVPETAMTIAGTVFTPFTFRSTILASQELLSDSVNIQAVIRRAIVESFANNLDREVMTGTTEILGIRTLANLTQLDLSAALTAADPYNEVNDLREDLLDANAPDPAGHPIILHQREHTKMVNAVDSGQRMPPPSTMNGSAFLISQHIATNEAAGTNESSLYWSGAWDNIIIGMRSELRVQTLVERYSENFQHGFLASMRFDMQAGNAAAVGRLIGIQPV